MIIGVQRDGAPLWAPLAERFREMILQQPNLSQRELKEKRGTARSSQTSCTVVQRLRLHGKQRAHRHGAGSAGRPGEAGKAYARAVAAESQSARTHRKNVWQDERRIRNNVAATVGGNQNGTTTINGQGTPGTPSVELINSTGAASGVTLSLSFSAAVDTGAAGSGADYSGPYPAKVSAWPTTSLADGFFSQINNGGSTMNMSFTGLDDDLTYDLPGLWAGSASGASG